MVLEKVRGNDRWGSEIKLEKEKGSGKNAKTTKRRRGFTLIEMVLVLASLVALLGVVFTIYKTRIEPSRWAQNKYQVFQSVVGAIETAKNANGGAYPKATGVDLGSTTPPSNEKAKLVWSAVTGGRPSTDTAGWSYSCSGGNLDIKVNISDKPSDAALNIFKSLVESNTGMTEAGHDANSITFRKAGVVCW